MLCAGMDPMATYDRLPAELPRHDPLADARQSARLLVEALRRSRIGAKGYGFGAGEVLPRLEATTPREAQL